MNKKYNIVVTERQLHIIRDACELYGRVQIGQFAEFSQLICRSGLRTEANKLNPEAEARAEQIKTFLDIIWKEAGYQKRERSDSEMIALDIWAILDKRRNADDFCLGTEPNISVKEIPSCQSPKAFQAVCPECFKSSSLKAWNKSTENYYGEGITPLIEEDFVEDGFVQKNSEAGECDYFCPKCQSVVLGQTIQKVNKAKKGG